MPAAIKNITRDLGATRPWRMTFYQGKSKPPVDLTGCAAMLFLADRMGGPEAELSVANGGIALGGSAGTIEVDLAHASYTALPAGEYSYRLALAYSDSKIELLTRGTWSIR